MRALADFASPDTHHAAARRFGAGDDDGDAPRALAVDGDDDDENAPATMGAARPLF